MLSAYCAGSASLRSRTSHQPNNDDPAYAPQLVGLVSGESQALQGGGIELAVTIFAQCCNEELIVGSCLCEEAHRRSELKIVGIAQDLLEGTSLHLSHQLSAFPQPRSENGMVRVRRRFFLRSDGEKLRHVTAAQSSDLRKNEPYPMASLPPLLKL